MQITAEAINSKLKSLGKRVWKMSAPIESIDGSIRTAMVRSLKTLQDLEKIEDNNVAIFKVWYSEGVNPNLEPADFNHMRYASWKNKT